MTVTFDITNDSRAVWRRSVLRLLVGDSAEGDGPRPKGGNYADDELDTFLMLEADGINRAAARTFEALAAEWSRYAGSYRLGPESEEARQAAEFAARATAMRAVHGWTTSEDGTDDGDSSGIVDWSDAFRNWVGKF